METPKDTNVPPASKDVPSEEGKKGKKEAKIVEKGIKEDDRENIVEDFKEALNEPAEDEKSVAPKEEKKKDSKKDNKKVDSKDKKPELVREYVVPMRREFIKAPEYRKSKKAVKALKQFLAKHMKVVDRDIDKVKIDIYLNNEIWHRGIRKPLPRVKVIAEKRDGIVYARLAEVPEAVKFKMAKDEKRLKKVDKKAVAKVKKQEDAEKDIKEGRSDKQDKVEEFEKEKAGAESKELSQEKAAKTMKQTTSAKPKKVDVGVTQRKSLKK
jgi:ribosomal protein L31E